MPLIEELPPSTRPRGQTRIRHCTQSEASARGCALKRICEKENE